MLHAAPGRADLLRRIQRACAAGASRLTGDGHRHKRVLARQQVTDADVAGRVHRRTRHPAVLTVIGAVGALLVQRPVAVALVLAHLVPADTRAAATNIHGMGGHHRPVGTEVANLQTMHEPVGDRFQRRPTVRLRDTGLAGGAAEVAVVRRYSYRVDLAHGGVFRVPVDVDLPDIECAGSRHRGREQRIRRSWSIEIAGNESELARPDVEADQRRRLAGVHCAFVHDAEERAREVKERAARPEDVGDHRDRIADDAVFRIVVEADVVEREFIAVVAAGRVAGFRNRDTLREGVQVIRERELAHEPAIGNLVIKYDRIALVERLAVAAGAVPECVTRKRGRDDVAILVIDRRQKVDHLHEMIRPNRAIGIGRCNQDAKESAVIVVRCAWEPATDRRRGAHARAVLQRGRRDGRIGCARQRLALTDEVRHLARAALSGDIRSCLCGGNRQRLKRPVLGARFDAFQRR